LTRAVRAVLMATMTWIPYELRSIAVAAACALLPAPQATALPPSDSAELRTALQARLDALRTETRAPGCSFAIALQGGTTIALVSGVSDTGKQTPLTTSDRLLQGSVGKTYVSAIALQLVHEKKLDLADPVSKHLGKEPWFARLPNASDITVRQLMTHTSGLVRYEFQPKFAQQLTSDPLRSYTPVERLEFVFDTQAPFAAGQGFEYSDTNYIVLGMIVESVTERPYYDELKRRLLDPLGLKDTIPTDGRDLPGVVVGYAGKKNALGGYDASIVDGRFAVNPQFEWTGGGVASTTADLARWAKHLYEGRAFDPSLLPQLVDGGPAPALGRDARYGLGVIVRPTELGPSHGHSGFFPGYATEMAYYPELGIAAAVQVNSTDPYPRGLGAFLVEAARTARGP